MPARNLLIPLVMLTWLVGSSALLAQDRTVVERGKAASVLVDNQSAKGIGSGFCIHPSGLFVTNNHVVEGLSLGDTLRLVRNSNSEDQQEFDAKLIRIDKKNDLAILEATTPDKFTALKLDSGSELHETMTTVAFGFPFGKGLALVKGENPTISVNVGKITSIRKDKQGVQLIQLDTALNPGNSGGPVLNEKGDVVGIVSFGLLSTGINFAIPASKAIALLEEPVVTARIPYLAPDQAKPLKAQVAIKALTGPVSQPSVEVWIKRGAGPSKRFNLTSVGNEQFEGLISVSTDEAPVKSFPGSIEFAKGRVEGEIANATFSLKGKSLDLTQIEGIEFGGKDQEATVTLKNGDSQTGVITNLPTLSVEVGGQVLRIDLSKATNLSLKPNDNNITVSHIIIIIIIVKSGDKVIYRSQMEESRPTNDANDNSVAVKSLPRTDRPTKPDTDDADTDSPDFDISSLVPGQMHASPGSSKKLPMPGTITDVNLMGGGSYLAVTLGNDKKLVMINLFKAAIAKVLPLTSTDCFITGNAKHLFVADGARGVLERYDLDSFKRELAIKLPFDGVLQSMTAGYASNSPILVRKSAGTEQLSQATFTLLDPIKMKEIKLDHQNSGHYSSFRDILHVRASANGRVFGMWCTSHTPQGLQTLTLTDAKAQVKYEHNSAGHVVPSLDGMYVFTGGSGVMTSELRALSVKPGRHVPCVPTSHPRFYISIPFEPGAQMNMGEDPYRGVKPGVHEVGNEAALIDLPDLELGRTNENASWTTNDFTLDKRVYYLLSANQLITVPFSNDQVLLKEFDLKRELAEAKLDHFFITSSPDRFFTPGSTYRYQIEVQTNQRKVECTLTSAPEGMSISDKGLITWRVPKNFTDETVDVIVSVTAGEIHQSYDNFTLTQKASRR